MIKRKLLLVDDDAVMRLAVIKCFETGSDTDVLTVDSGDKVLQLLEAGEQIDCLIIDWNMPGLNGYDLVCAVRANPRFDGIRILMLTARNSMADVKAALEAGADEYLMKPFTKEMLLSKLSLVNPI